MYPQMTGVLEIPSITFKGIVVEQNRSVDPFEAFFNGGSGYVEVKKNIVEMVHSTMSVHGHYIMMMRDIISLAMIMKRRKCVIFELIK